MFDKIKLGEKLKELRVKKGLNQTELANALLTTQDNISRLEKGNKEFSCEMLYNISSYFNVSVDYLLGLSEVESVDTNIKAICDYTGLSEDSVNTCNFIKNLGFNLYFNTINLLLESPISYLLKEIDRAEVKENELHELNLLTSIHDFLRVNDNSNEAISISEDGNITSISKNGVDILSVKTISQNEIIEKILLDEIVEKLKKAKVLLNKRK